MTHIQQRPREEALRAEGKDFRLRLVGLSRSFATARQQNSVKYTKSYKSIQQVTTSLFCSPACHCGGAAVFGYYQRLSKLTLLQSRPMPRAGYGDRITNIAVAGSSEEYPSQAARLVPVKRVLCSLITEKKVIQYAV